MNLFKRKPNLNQNLEQKEIEIYNEKNLKW